MPRKPQPRPRPVGRPKSIPTGATIRGIRLTAAEFVAVKEFVAKLRTGQAPT